MDSSIEQLDEELGLSESDEAVILTPDQGEDESDLPDSAASFSASIGGKDWTVETLVSQMRKGRIDLAPSFQRRNAWLGNRKSKLVESMILGFPIPQIVLAEKPDDPGHFFVLDGKQRLLALRQFFVDPEDERDKAFKPLSLSGLEVLTTLNRLDVSGLESKHPNMFAALENHSIRTVVLGKWNSEKLLLSLFLRLNTGSVPLSPQELRQALIPGEFMSWLDRTSGEAIGMRILLLSSHPDRRMVDAELTLRHLAFSTSPIRYQGNLKKFLDDTSRYYNKDWSALRPRAEEAVERMNEATKCILDVFGIMGLCRKWSGTRFERALNRAIFDIQAYSFSIPRIRLAASANADAIVDQFKRACTTNVPFIRSISSTTKTSEAFTTRHTVWRDILRDKTGEDYPLPEPLARN